MSINATSLRNSAVEYRKPVNSNVAFGRKENNEGHKSHKGVAIAATVVGLAALAGVAYAFRGKIANSAIFKKAVEFGNKVVGKTKDVSKEAFEKLKDLKDVAAKKAADLKNKVQPEAAEVWSKISEQASKLYEQMKNVVTKK